jgi:hypothetical protein
MSIKDKDKNNDNESVTANRIIPVITVFYAIKQAEQMIKIKKPKSFSGNKKAFLKYVTSIRFFI